MIKITMNKRDEEKLLISYVVRTYDPQLLFCLCLLFYYNNWESPEFSDAS